MKYLSICGTIFTLFLIGCNSRPAAVAGKDSVIRHQEIASIPGALTIDPALLKKYREACRQDTVPYDKKFISNFFEIVSRFNGKKLDTTVLTIGNLDGDNEQDTIFSRVYYDRDNIYVDSKWIKNDHVLWKEKYTNPYRELDANLFNDSSSNTWLFFAIGVLYGAPDIVPRKETDSVPPEMTYDQGVEDLKQAGIPMDKEQYKSYLQEFKGDFLTCGDPNSRERVWVWYKPAARMITYFQP